MNKKGFFGGKMAQNRTNLLIISLIILLFFMGNGIKVIPVTGEQSAPTSDLNENRGAMLQLENGTQLLVAGQPTGSIGYVSNMPGVVTRFQQADKLGSIGLIAHNYLSGEEFFGLQIGDRIMMTDELVNETSEYRVIAVEQYQALQPTSIHSQFRNLDNDETISAHQLSQRIYGQAGHMILQTCIENEGNLEWGRLFIIAEPINL
jgi:hypothetical protein